MINKQRYNLVKLIYHDLLQNYKIPIILLIFLLFSGILVVTIVHNTRLLTMKREQLMLEREILDIEWRNLTLEENALGDHSRIERIAIKKLHMQHIDPQKENIILIP
ncbi:Cell division protein FtsL [Serratia symbiotica]|nr:Cell division protein FtsL [Serratia symbiotica]